MTKARELSDLAGVVAVDTSGNVVFNETGTDADFRVESDNNDHMLFVDAANNRVGIGTNSPSHSLDVYSVSGNVARVTNGSSGGTPSNTHGEFIVESGDANMGIQLLGTATSNQRILFGDPDSVGSGQLAYDHTSNYMSFFANTSERMRIDSSGNVGIGTSSPDSVLHVNESGADILTVSRSGGADANTAVRWKQASTSWYAGTTSNNSFAFKYNSADLSINANVVINSSGNVGIGTSSPAKALHVVGSVADTALFGGINAGTSTENIGGIQLGTITDLATRRVWGIKSESTNQGMLGFWVSADNASNAFSGTQVVSIDRSGNVGIGTTSPQARLHVSGPALTQLYLSDTGEATDQKTWGFQYGTGIGAGTFRLRALNDAVTNGQNAYIITRTGFAVDTHQWLTANTERMRIDSAGTVILKGPTDNSLQFHESGVERARIGPNSGSLRFLVGSTSVPSMVIDSSGNVGIGTTEPASGTTGGASFTPESDNRRVLRLASTTTSGITIVGFFNPNGVVGTISTTGSATAYNTSSDYRLKEDVQPMVGAVDRLMALKPVNFAWKVDGTRVDGFLAHEAQEIVPEAVTGEKDAVDADGNPEYQGIDQSKLLPVVVAALQDSIKRIESLEAELLALKGNANA